MLQKPSPESPSPRRAAGVFYLVKLSSVNFPMVAINKRKENILAENIRQKCGENTFNKAIMDCGSTLLQASVIWATVPVRFQNDKHN